MKIVLISYQAFIFLLLTAGSYPLPLDQVEWTHPKYNHQN